MKYGMQSLYEFDSMEHNLKLAKELELNFIELNLDYPYIQEALSNPKDLKKLFDAANLEMTIRFYDEIDFASHDNVNKAYIDLFRKNVENAQIAGAKMITINLALGKYTSLNGRIQYYHEKDKDYYDKLKKNLDTLKSICESFEIDFSICNTNVPDYMRKMYRTLYEDSYTFSYDLGMDYLHEKKMARVIKHYPLNISTYYVHDANKEVCYLPLGEGEIDLALAKKLIGEGQMVFMIKDSWDLVRAVKYWKTIEE